MGNEPGVSAWTKSNLSRRPVDLALRLIRRFLANLASSTKATIFSKRKALSSSLRKSNTVWSVRSLELTQPETRTLPSRLGRAATGSGCLRYSWMLSAGLICTCFWREGGPPAPQEEMYSCVDDDGAGGVVILVDGPTKNAETVAALSSVAMAKGEWNFIFELSVWMMYEMRGVDIQFVAMMIQMQIKRQDKCCFL